MSPYIPMDPPITPLKGTYGFCLWTLREWLQAIPSFGASKGVYIFCRVSGLGFRASGLGLRIWGLGCRVLDLGFRVQGLGRLNCLPLASMNTVAREIASLIRWQCLEGSKPHSFSADHWQSARSLCGSTEGCFTATPPSRRPHHHCWKL